MRRCPKCSRNVPEEGRVCRSCYTVLPEIDPAVLVRRRKRAKTISGLVQLLIIFGVAGAAWTFRFNVDFFPDTRLVIRSSFDSSQRYFNSFFMKTDEAVAATSSDASVGGKADGKGFRRVSANSINRQGRNCDISQTVRNEDSSAMSPIILHFTFEDALGKRFGSEARGVVDEALPAGAERTFILRVPCPRSFAHAKVRPWHAKAKVGDTDIALASNGQKYGSARANVTMLKLAIKVPAKTACHSSGPCDLTVRFEDGSEKQFSFRRDPQAEDVLIADDAQLTTHLQKGGTAKLLVPITTGVGSVTLTDQDLGKLQDSSEWVMFTHWIRNFFKSEEAGW